MNVSLHFYFLFLFLFFGILLCKNGNHEMAIQMCFFSRFVRNSIFNALFICIHAIIQFFFMAKMYLPLIISKINNPLVEFEKKKQTNKNPDYLANLLSGFLQLAIEIE